MTGIGTVLADDPSFNVRSSGIDTKGLQPMRVVLDSRLRIPVSAGMLALPGETIVCHSGDTPGSELGEAGATVEPFKGSGSQIDVAAVLSYLGGREVNNLLVEAGPTLAGHLLQNKLVDELVIYQAPHIMGSETRRLVETPGWQSLADRQELLFTDVRKVGSDTRITARPVN